MRIGIDPDTNGAIAFLEDDLSLIKVVDMPVMPLGQRKQQINGAELAKILSGHNTTVLIEQASAMPGQGVSATFNNGVSFGIVRGVCAGLMIPTIIVHPTKWKKAANVSKKPKDYARTIAQLLYPGAELHLKKHVGRADAILIARFGSAQT